MELTEIKQISIRDYLASIDCNPKTEKSTYGMYISPYRTDEEASLKVDYTLNLWHDFGNGEGGSIIDLVMKIEQCDFKEAIKKLKNDPIASNSFSFHCNILPKYEPEMQVKKIEELSNPALLEYLKSRKIDIEIAKMYCEEVYYTLGDKTYFAIAFRSNSGALELRNKYFKGCIGRKDITTVKNRSDSLLVFEGFMDMLSFATYYGKDVILSLGFIVLNSLSNIEKAERLFSSFKKIHLYLDNDEAGSKYTDKLLAKYDNVLDRRDAYLGYKDFNDFLTKTDQ